MTYNLLLFVQGCSILLLGLESMYVFVNWKSKGHSNLFIYCFSVFIANIAYMGEMLASNYEEASALARMGYLGRVWVPVAFLAIICDFCETKIPQWIMHTLIIIQATILVIVQTSPFHNIYYTSERYFVFDGIFPHKVMGHAPLHDIYFIYASLYIFVGLFILIRRAVIDRYSKRLRFYPFIFGSIAAMSTAYVLYILKIPNGYDMQALGYTICSILFFIAIFRYNLMDSLSIVKDYIMDTISDGVLATDYRGNVIYYNDLVMDILPQCRLLPHYALSTIKERLEKAEVIEHKDKIYEVTCTPLYKNDDITGLVYIIHDVTSKHQHMIELQEQKDIAEAANASKSKFLSMVSHEIRTPMNSVVGMSEVLIRDGDNLNDKQLRYLGNIKTSGESLVSMVNDLLDQSKIEAGKMEIIEDNYSLSEILNDVRMIIENRLEGKPVELVFTIDNKIPDMLLGDGLRIKQVLINLMNNSVKFTDSGKIKLSISLVQENEDGFELHYSISDTGQGIKEEDLTKLGQAFSQVDTKKNHGKEGTGLGLLISGDLVGLMGGEIKVSSTYGQGSEFYFNIWQKRADLSLVEDSTESINLPDGVSSIKDVKLPHASCLIVDDNELNLIIAEEILKPLQMHIKTCTSGAEAIELIKSHRYDVILMDYMMPEMDGLETTKRIRSMSNEISYLSKLPIIALTGDAASDTEEALRAAGINDITYKPMEFNKVTELLLKWL